MPSNEEGIRNTKLSELASLAGLFLRLGATSFGGPAVHISMMREELVTRRKLLSEEEFLDYLGITQLIPGPNSTEMAIHLGRMRCGIPGLFIAGISFILPAMLIVWMTAWIYVQYGSLPVALGILYGIKPVIIAVVLQAVWGLGRASVKSLPLGLIGVISLSLYAQGTSEIAIIFLAGAIHLAFRRSSRLWILTLVSPFSGAHGLASAASGLASVSGPKIFFIFLKVGSVLFGSGYVLLAFLRTEFVERLGWLTESQLLDATALGQFTPGPVFTTATFIGYLLAGSQGALLATLGIFIPAFFFVAISAPWVPRLKKSQAARFFLDGVNVASLALMAHVAWKLAAAAIVDTTTSAAALVAAVLLIRFQINSVWLVLAGGILGFTHVYL